MVPRLDILPPQQRDLWPDLAAVPRRFVLYGGTAIALRLGHRESVDFDFFASAPLDLDGLVGAWPELGRAPVIRQQPDAFAVFVERRGLPVRVSFFGALRNGRVGDPEATVDGVLRLASRRDLLAHKLKVILQRAEGKDYQDIAALLADGLTLAEGLGAACALFPGFPVMESARALGYRDDIGEPERVGPASAAALDAAVAGLPAAIPRIAVLSADMAAP